MPYAQVVIWAVIPAILYYVACFAAVHFEAKRRGLVGLPRSELPRLRSVLRERGHLFIPILDHPGRHVFRLQRADGGAVPARWPASRSRCCASRPAAT